jgi:hypothetical protein
MTRTSISLEIILKASDFLKKPQITFKKSSVPLKMSSKSLVIFIKASHYWKSLRLLVKPHITLKKDSVSLKIPSKESNSFQKPQSL